MYQQLEELQKRDWKELSVDEKKAGELDLFFGEGAALTAVRSGEGEGGVEDAGYGHDGSAKAAEIKKARIDLVRSRT